MAPALIPKSISCPKLIELTKIAIAKTTNFFISFIFVSNYIKDSKTLKYVSYSIHSFYIESIYVL
ncbi:hypothetical protein GCM10008083_31540 [Ulvibacter litoralis]|nr:hypothetical protein GCM10008083_31540 [Ulvibacter litoralis]